MMRIDRLCLCGNGTAFAFTTERGYAGNSGPYSEFNCCGYTGDSPEHVAMSRDKLCNALGIPAERLITARQVHGTDVAIISDYNQRAGEADALVTNLQGIAIGIFTADCVPMLFYDNEADVIGAAHAGWKGTMNGIAANTIKAMSALGASAGNIQAAFGPSICQECFEVGDEVVEQFRERGLPLDKIMQRNKSTGKAHIDLVEANIFWMEKCGIDKNNILRSQLCTKCNPSRFFSARALGTKSGRNLTGILIKTR